MNRTKAINLLFAAALTLALSLGISPGLVTTATAQSAAADPVVHLQQGDLRGRADGAALAFLNVPYAAPPTGRNRWRAPQPTANWRGMRDATRYGPGCIQQVLPGGRPPWTHEYMVSGPVSEDCLSLNVWTPGTTGTPKPVLVWIHGGGFSEGSGSVPIYRGAALAGRDIVVVTINYRLGIYGFLAHPELTREAGEGAASNFGLQDQIAALRWVRHNISRFGGDPDQVTIAGQSAGSMAVHSLVASPLATGLFHRAIAQSGLPTIMPMQTLAQAEEVGSAFAQYKGAPTIARLRAMTPSQLALAADGGTGGASSFRPMVDGRLLPATPGDMVARAAHNDVAMIVGQTADEGSAFPGYGSGTIEAYQAFMSRSFGAEAELFMRLYPAQTDAERSAAVIAASRDRGLAMIDAWARVKLARGSSPVWAYYHTHPEPGEGSAEFGAFHSSEIPYIFATLDMSPERQFTLADRNLSLVMSSYWVNFVKTGNPNGPGLPQWRPTSPEVPTVQEFGTGGAGERPLLHTPYLVAYRQYVAEGGALSMF